MGALSRHHSQENDGRKGARARHKIPAAPCPAACVEHFAAHRSPLPLAPLFLSLQMNRSRIAFGLLCGLAVCCSVMYITSEADVADESVLATGFGFARSTRVV